MRWLPAPAVLLLAICLTGNPGVTGPIPWLTLFINGICLVLAAALLWRQGVEPFPKMSFLASLLLLLSQVSSSSSLSPPLSQLSIASQAGFVSCVILFELGIRSRAAWLTCSLALAVIAAFSALYGLSVNHWLAVSEPLKANFTNSDCYSLIPLLGLFPTLSLLLDQRIPFRSLWILVFSLLAVTVTLTASRSAGLALAGGLCAFLIVLASSSSQRWKSVATKLFLAPFALVLIGMVTGTNSQLIERYSQLGRGQDPVAVKSRWDVIRYGYRTVLRAPVLGCGPGCFHLAYQQDRPPMILGEDFMNVAHNDHLQWLIETGIVGALCWLALFLTALWGTWKSYKCPTNWVAAQFASLTAIFVYCCFNFAVPVPADSIWIGSCFGLTGALTRLEQSASPHPWKPKVFPWVLLLALTGIWASWQSLRWYHVERYKALAARAEKSLDWEQAIEFLQAAARESEDHRVQLQLAKLLQKAYVLTGKKTWQEQLIQAIDKAYRINPYDLQVLLSSIALRQQLGQEAELKALLEKTEKIAPQNPYVRRARARVQILGGQFDAAATTLASIESGDVAQEDEALAELIYLLEARQPASGPQLLSKIAQTSLDRATQLALRAGRIAHNQNDPATALRLFKFAANHNPARGDVMLELALARGKSGDSRAELKILDGLRRKQNLDVNDETLARIWNRWSELEVDRGNLQLVLSQLDDFLLSHQRETWARLRMAEVFLRRGQKAEARGALRDGLPYDQNGDIRIQLGDMCANQGLPDLARSYYSEALKISKNRALVEEKLRQLKASSSDEDDLIFADPEKP